MNGSHLSDEAVAAFADGVLGTLARERAQRHTRQCPECAQAVQAQREAALLLRSAGPPPLPTGLLDRLRTVPQTTPLHGLPTVIGPDGAPMLATAPLERGGPMIAPMAALVPPAPQAGRRVHPVVATAAVVALAGALTAGAVAADSAASAPGDRQPGVTVPAGTHIKPALVDWRR